MALFQSALDAVELPFQVLFIHGPGGVGKTTLLNEYRAAVRRKPKRAPITSMRATSNPTPESFLAALRAALNLPDDKSVLHTLAEQPHTTTSFSSTRPRLLLPIDNWLRDVCLPQLPENTLVVMAGREPPSAAWHSDAGWQTLIRVLPLRNLAPDESRAYLNKRSIPGRSTAAHPELHARLSAGAVAGGRGLCAAARRCANFSRKRSLIMIKMLLERFVQKVPGPAHRAALEACALVRVTTEALLSEMLGSTRARTNCLSGCATCRSSKHERRRICSRTIWRAKR